MNVFFTCGIGDFIAIDSYLTAAEKHNINRIFWATRQRRAITQLVPFCFPNLKNQVTVFDSFRNAPHKLFCFASMGDMKNKIGISMGSTLIEDLSIVHIWHQIFRHKRQYHYSSLAAKPLADISKFDLPDRYCLVHPWSDNMPNEKRDLEPNELRNICLKLKNAGIPAVVVNQSKKATIECEGVIDLSNKTTLLETLEITKKCNGFIGCASFPSVMATKMLPPNKVLVKAKPEIKNRDWVCYYAPFRKNDFIKERIGNNEINVLTDTIK